MNITFATDKEGNISPQIKMPYNWSNNFYSAIGYESGTISSVDKGMDDPALPAGEYKFSDTATTNHFWLDVLGYQNRVGALGYAIGGVVSYKNIKLGQFGYFGKTGSGASAVATAFSNDRDIEVYQVGLNMDASLKNIANFFSFRLGANVYPYSSLSVKHDLEVIGVVDQGTESESTQPFAYRIESDAYIDTGVFVDFSFSGLYEIEPLTYDMVRGNSSGTFESENVSTSYTRLRGEAKLVFSAMGKDAMNPMIGYAYERVTSGIDGEDSLTVENNLLLLGFEKKF